MKVCCSQQFFKIFGRSARVHTRPTQLISIYIHSIYTVFRKNIRSIRNHKEVYIKGINSFYCYIIR
jgi:hypothetical protein